MADDIHIPHADELLTQTDAIQAGLDFLQERVRGRAPVLTGRLRSRILTEKTSPTEGKVFLRLIYAEKQEYRNWQKHPHGGGSEFFHLTFALDGDEVFNRVGARLFKE